MVVKHHAGGLRGLARRVRNVEALDRQGIEVFLRQIQRLGQGARARLLRARLGQQARQLQVGILARHVEPGAVLTTRLVHHAHALSGLLRQRLRQHLVHRLAGDQQGRHGHADVVLRDEGLQHLLLHRRGRSRSILGGIDTGSILHMHREVGPVAQVAAAAHHGQVHAGAATLHAHGKNVHVLVRGGFHRLLVQHARERRDLVAQLGRLLELQPLGVGHHARLQLLQERLGFAAQKRLGVRHVLRIGLGRYQAHAGRGAALDLVEQAGPRAVGKHRVLAGAQAEHLLQQLDGFLHRPAVRVRAKVAVPLVDAATVVGHARKALECRLALPVLGSHAGDLEERVALVVAEQDVVPGVLRLDEVVLQQQRLGLGAHHRGLQARDLAHHVADARAAVLLGEIAGHALLEVARLAHIQQRALGVEIAVHARQGWQRSHLRQQFFGMPFLHGAIVRRQCGPCACKPFPPRCNGTSSAA